MADWLKVEVTLAGKPEVKEIAAALQISKAEVIGRLFLVWAWFDQHTESGNARVTLDALDDEAGLRGFAQAMAEVAWLSTGAKGTVTLPNFERHNGKTAKKRALTQKRAQRFRNASVTQGASLEESSRELTPKPPIQRQRQTLIPCPDCRRLMESDDKCRYCAMLKDSADRARQERENSRTAAKTTALAPPHDPAEIEQDIPY